MHPSPNQDNQPPQENLEKLSIVSWVSMFVGMFPLYALTLSTIWSNDKGLSHKIFMSLFMAYVYYAISTTGRFPIIKMVPYTELDYQKRTQKTKWSMIGIITMIIITPILGLLAISVFLAINDRNLVQFIMLSFSFGYLALLAGVIINRTKKLA